MLDNHFEKIKKDSYGYPFCYLNINFFKTISEKHFSHLSFRSYPFSQAFLFLPSLHLS